MTQDKIIRSPLGREQLVALALEAGMLDINDRGLYGDFVNLERFAALVAAHEREKLKNVAIFSRWYQELDAAVLAEREACAKVCESFKSKMDAGLDNVAAAIRVRGEK